MMTNGDVMDNNNGNDKGTGRMTTIDIHALQTVPPSCLNRDGTGSPKTGTYGGVRRMRVSSQAWKHAIRNYAVERFGDGTYGTRTKNLAIMIADGIVAKGGASDRMEAVETVREILKEIGFTFGSDSKKKDNAGIPARYQLEALFFVGNGQVDKVADIILDETLDEKERNKRIREALTYGVSVDVALFGRMLASDTSLNVTGAAEVGQALGVSPMQTEYDYYTAIDEHSLESHVGSAMMGDIEFDSGVVYRYATISVPLLIDNLNMGREGESEDTALAGHAIREFFDAFINSIPSGRQHAFAAETLPDTVIIDIHDGRARSMVGAFESPIVPGDDGIMGGARHALTDYITRVDEAYGFNGKRFILSLAGDPGINGKVERTIMSLEDDATAAAMGDGEDR